MHIPETIDASGQVWLISGCSTGFGREIALAALAAGAQVAVTARRTEAVADICEAYPEQALALALDVTDHDQIQAAVNATAARFGHIDVLVNNAGYGYLAAVEEGEEEGVRGMFETNFFGALALTRAVLPLMRQRGSGHIINNSSQAGLMANPGTAFYSASKYALEGLMEGLGKEVAPLGIRVSSIQPGAFRTDWSGRSMQRSGTRLPEYEELVGARLDMIANIDGKQPGDPKRGAHIFLALAQMESPPAQLVLGEGIWTTYREKLEQQLEQLDQWRETSLSVDFPPE